MFIKACLDGLIDEVDNKSGKCTSNQEKDFERGTIGKVAKASNKLKPPNTDFEAENSNLQLIKMAVNIWNRYYLRYFINNADFNYF